MSSIEQKIKEFIREVPDFPKQGVNFKDITTLLENPSMCREITNYNAETYKSETIDAIVGIESRGFLFGFTMAIKLGVPFILARKKGKLPGQKISYSYDLEYGTSIVEMHSDSIKPGDRVLIHDDLLATGGTANAVAELVKLQQGTVIGFNFLIELSFLTGRQTLEQQSNNIVSLVKYH